MTGSYYGQLRTPNQYTREGLDHPVYLPSRKFKTLWLVRWDEGKTGRIGRAYEDKTEVALSEADAIERVRQLRTQTNAINIGYSKHRASLNEWDYMTRDRREAHVTELAELAERRARERAENTAIRAKAVAAITLRIHALDLTDDGIDIQINEDDVTLQLDMGGSPNRIAWAQIELPEEGQRDTNSHGIRVDYGFSSRLAADQALGVANLAIFAARVAAVIETVDLPWPTV